MFKLAQISLKCLSISNYSKMVHCYPSLHEINKGVEEKKSAAIETIKVLLKVPHLLAVNLILCNQCLVKASNKLLLHNYELCKQYGVKREILISHPEILCQRDLVEKFNGFNDISFDINKRIDLIKLNKCIFQEFVMEVKRGHENRLTFFSKLLNVI